MKKAKVKLTREQIAFEMLKVIVAKVPYTFKKYNDGDRLDLNDIAHLAARGAVDYADALLHALKEKSRV